MSPNVRILKVIRPFLNVHNSFKNYDIYFIYHISSEKWVSTAKFALQKLLSVILLLTFHLEH